MGFWTSNVAGGIVRWGVATLIAGVCFAVGFSPDRWIAAVIKAPPGWLSSPLARLAGVSFGVAVFLVVANWQRLTSSAIDRQRRAVVNAAFSRLTPEAYAWVAEHFASGRPSDDIGVQLNALHLIDRDFVGWTEIKSELKAHVADRVRTENSLIRRYWHRAKNMTSIQLSVVCLLISILFAAIAVAILLRSDLAPVSNAAIPDQLASPLGDVTKSSSAPIARLAELGWTVTPQPDRLQFSAQQTLPPMAQSAELFRQLHRPFVLVLQQLSSLDGLRYLADIQECSEISVGAGEFTDVSELRGFVHLTKLSISQTPLNGHGILDASPLSALINLHELNLGMSRIKDANFVSGMSQLEKLYLGQTLIAELPSLSSLAQLRYLAIRGTRVVDLRPLRQSLLLEELEIGGAQVAALGSLSHLDNLKRLTMIEQGEVELEAIGSLASLENLFVWGPPRIDLSAIAQLRKLKNLSISGLGFGPVTSVTNAESISRLSSLEVLSLGGLQLNELDFVSRLERLSELNLNELPVASIEPVRSLLSLKKISLTSTRVVDLTPLINLPALEEVRIMRTPARADVVSILEKRGVKVTVY